MAIHVERGTLDEKRGRYRYFICFARECDKEDAYMRVPVEIAVSVSETGDLADLSFQLPKPCRTELATALLRNEPAAKQVDSRVFISVPGQNGDVVLSSAGELQMDAAGRIVAVNIHPF